MATRGGVPFVPSGPPRDRWGLDVDSGEEHCVDLSASAAGGRGSAGAAIRRPTILIVDDEPMIGTTLRVLLADRHEVVLAESGADARAALEGTTFDLILCDLMMPGVSGMDLHAWLLERSPEAAGRMVFMTGGVFTDEARSFLEHVPNRRIEKPFDTRDLLRLIEDELVEADQAG